MGKIPPPAPDKQPLKANIFECMRAGNCTLLPLFPYFDEGAIVPAGTLFEHSGRSDFGFFQHRNDVDEIFLCFASWGSRIRSGSVRVGAREHLVGNPFLDDAYNDAFALVAIVQAQRVGRPQREEIVFRCVQCHRELLRRTFDATPPPRGRQLEVGGHQAVFPTLSESLATYHLYNREHRVCAHCGTESPRFPIERWGQDEYVGRSHIVRLARELFAAETGSEESE